MIGRFYISPEDWSHPHMQIYNTILNTEIRIYFPLNICTLFEK